MQQLLQNFFHLAREGDVNANNEDSDYCPDLLKHYQEQSLHIYTTRQKKLDFFFPALPSACIPLSAPPSPLPPPTTQTAEYRHPTLSTVKPKRIRELRQRSPLLTEFVSQLLYFLFILFIQFDQIHTLRFILGSCGHLGLL